MIFAVEIQVISLKICIINVCDCIARNNVWFVGRMKCSGNNTATSRW